MILTEYQLIYLLTGLFEIYTINKFMQVFFDKRISSAVVELISYAIYSIMVATVSFYISIPLLAIILYLSAFYGLSYNYKSTVGHRIMSAVYATIVLKVIEIIINLSSPFFAAFFFGTTVLDNSVTLIMIRLLSFMLVMALGKLKRAKEGHRLTPGNWIAVLIVPVGSIYLVITILQAGKIPDWQIITSIMTLLLANIMIFQLYDSILLKVEQEMEREMLLQQNICYVNQFSLMKATEETMRGFRHDFMNHIAVLGSLLDDKNQAGAQDYIEQISQASVNAYRHVDSGNMDFDCILNLKLQEAANRGVKFTAKVVVPEAINMNTFDLTTILGNLLDNAIEAASQCEKDRDIDIMITYSKGRLVIQISNSFDHEVIIEKGMPATTKKDKKNHGIGLKHVAQTLDKYNGVFNLSSAGGRFKVVAMAYDEQA